MKRMMKNILPDMGAFILPGIFFYSQNLLAADIRDVAPPVDLPPDYFGALIVLGIVLAVLLGWLGYFWSKRFKKARRVIEKLKKVIPPWEIAFRNLEELRQDNLMSPGLVKEFYIRLSDVVRRYIEDRFHIHAPEMTTEEFLFSLGASSVLSPEQKEFLRNFLSHCDMVKFARHAATIAEMEQSFAMAKKLVEETRGTAS